MISSAALSPLCAVVRDELVSFLRRIASPKAGGWEQGLVEQLNTLWSTSFDLFDTAISAQADPVRVQSPAISLFGTATPTNFWSVLQGTQVANGLFSRFLVFESNARPDEQFPPVPVTVPTALKDDLAELYRFGCTEPLQMAQLNDPNIKFEPPPMPWTSEAEEVYRQLGKRIKREIDADPSQEEYLGRVAEQAMRLAEIRAAGITGHRAKVDAADMTWGADLASILVTRMMNRSRDCLPQTVRGEFAEKIVDYVIRHGLVTERELQKHVGSRYSVRDVKDMLNQSIASGAIVKLPNGSYASPAWVEANKANPTKKT